MYMYKICFITCY